MNAETLREAMAERSLVDRLRGAVQFCKNDLGMQPIMTDHKMTADERMSMEKCLTSNFLVKFGHDYFGKRDLLYIDMQGDRDIARQYTRELAEIGGDAGDDDDE